MIKAVIIDDEQGSVVALTSFLHAHCPQVAVLGSAHNIRTGKELMDTYQPQLVFLDIEMPGGSGFDLLRSLPSIEFEVVFITAYNQYAINAFRFSAVDYLLKPLRITQVKEAVQKAEQRMIEKASARNYELLLRNMTERDASQQRLAFTDRGEQYLVPLSDIMYLAGSSNYTHIHTRQRVFLTTTRLKDYEEMLPAEVFCRIHHSYIVNTTHIAKVLKGRGGVVVMQDGSELEIAFRRKAQFMSMFTK